MTWNATDYSELDSVATHGRSHAKQHGLPPYCRKSPAGTCLPCCPSTPGLPGGLWDLLPLAACPLTFLLALNLAVLRQ